MPKKKPQAKSADPQLVTKVLKFPADWIERIDLERGGTSFSDFIRSCVRANIDAQGLSEVPGWGHGRWKKRE
jgi:hypothetical protein